MDVDVGAGSVTSNRGIEQEKVAERDKLLAEVYRPEGCKLWLAHAEKNGWTLDEQIARLHAAADGTFV